MAKPKPINFEAITLRQQISSRGGGIEIDLTSLGFKGEKMSAYQNYLGGGMLAKVCANNTIDAKQGVLTPAKRTKLDNITEQLKKHYHALTNPEKDTFEHLSFEQNQALPASAY